MNSPGLSPELPWKRISQSSERAREGLVPVSMRNRYHGPPPQQSYVYASTRVAVWQLGGSGSSEYRAKEVM